jgi:hypothetical protein
MQEKDFRKMIQTDEARSNLVGNVMMDMLIDRTQTRLREIAQGLESEAETDVETGEVSDQEVPAEPIEAAAQVSQEADAQQPEGESSSAEATTDEALIEPQSEDEPETEEQG